MGNNYISSRTVVLNKNHRLLVLGPALSRPGKISGVGLLMAVFLLVWVVLSGEKMAFETVCWVLVFWAVVAAVGAVGRVIGDAGQITPPPPAEVVPANVIVLPGLGRERRSTDAAIRTDCMKRDVGIAVIPPPVPPSLLRRNPPADAERRVVVDVVVDVAAGSPRSLRITWTSSPARSFRFSAPELELEAGAVGCRLLLAAAIEGKTSEDLDDDDDDDDDEGALICEAQAVLLRMGGAFSND